MTSVAGLIASAVFWFVAMEGVVWTWNRHAAFLLRSGIAVDESDRRIDVRRVMGLHTIGWSVAILVFFGLLTLADLPLWQRVAFALVLAVAYGVSSINRGEREWAGKKDAKRGALFGRHRDFVWYRFVAACEWLGYLLALTFAADLIFGTVG